jgi:sugar lactone lactonase YvrE
MLVTVILIFQTFSFTCLSQSFRDPGTYGQPLELVHLYNDEWPTGTHNMSQTRENTAHNIAGIAVSNAGRKFSNYPPSLDMNNTNNGSNNKYTVAELIGNSSERAYPNAEWNNPPGGAINYTTNPPTGANYVNHLIGVQSVVVAPDDTLYILDTGRALTPDGMNVYATVPGGPKLVAVDLSTNTVTNTVVFPPTVAFPDSYLNDVRFDLRPSSAPSGKGGVAYITDSSTEGRNGIVIVDLGSGESWRHLDGHPSVRPAPEYVPWVWGNPLYSIPMPGQPATFVPFGSDGIALSADGETLFYGAVGSRYLYGIATALLRDRSQTSEIKCQQGVRNLGEKGVSDGFETDSNGIVYVGQMEQDAVASFDPSTGMVKTFVRDPRLSWVDTSM